LPKSYGRSSARFAVAYYLHGSGGSERNWIGRLALDSLADSLADATGREAIIVTPDGDAGYWADWQHPDSHWARCLQGSFRVTENESTEQYCVRRGLYETYLVREIVPFVDSAYRTLRDRRHRGIAGFSMGGYGAITLAARHPDFFSAAVSHSGVVSPLYVGPHPYTGWSRFATDPSEILEQFPASRHALLELEFGADTSGWWARDPFRNIERLLSERRRVPVLYLDIGTDDRYRDQNRAFVDTLKDRGVPHRYLEWPGGHDGDYWRAHAGEGLAWLLEHIAPDRPVRRLPSP
jgi:S-formylglutathione hydrolase FrmB